MSTAAIALVGDRSQSVRAHARIPMLVEALRRRDGVVLDPYWVASEDAEADGALERFDGIWVVPGSPFRSADGAINAARTAREREIPFLGTCAGFQHAVLMLARDLCGLERAAHAEYGPDGELVIVELECSLVGHEGAIEYAAGSLAQRVAGVERSVERYHCSYGLDRGYVDLLAEHGVRFSAHDDAGDARALELPGHPFFLATLFQPELAGDGTRAHPIVRAFADACVARAISRAAAPAADSAAARA
jgi:CTP synthase (UTP-ammonia lyase)